MLIACAFGALLWSGEACEWDGAHPDRAQVQNRTGTRWIEISSTRMGSSFPAPVAATRVRSNIPRRREAVGGCCTFGTVS
jgi:hypothetical protein